jgi:hypothetical protein
MKCWSVISKSNGFTAPELLKHYLNGQIYDDSRRLFSNGTGITTSSIHKITDCGTHKIVETKNTLYAVYPTDVDPAYESAFPGAYAKLQLERA